MLSTKGQMRDPTSENGPQAASAMDATPLTAMTAASTNTTRDLFFDLRNLKGASFPFAF